MLRTEPYFIFLQLNRSIVIQDSPGCRYSVTVLLLVNISLMKPPVEIFISKSDLLYCYGKSRKGKKNFVIRG